MINQAAGVIRLLNGDGRLLFSTRMLRLFAYGFLSVVLALYLDALGFSEAQIGLLLSLTLLGDTAISLWITTSADRIGRQRMLLVGAGLMLVAGIAFALTRDFYVLLLAATLGVISPSGNEVGPFLSIEQAALSQILPDERRTEVFAWYNLVGSFATALGALCGGGLASLLQRSGFAPVDSYRVICIGYALIGGVLGLIFLRLSRAVEPPQQASARKNPAPFDPRFGLTQSGGVVVRLSALFALDAFGGGFIVQSIMAYWFYVRFHVDPAVLGGIFFGANILAGFSALAAVSIARRIGLIRTMVFTHLPSNLLLMAVPFMPTLPLAIGLLLIRFSISQMDVPTRQSYTMAVVRPDERSAASGITGVARTIGAGLSPMFTGMLLANPALMAAPFLISGGIKVIYDLLLFASFQAVRPPEES
jgi:MFS family permease